MKEDMTTTTFTLPVWMNIELGIMAAKKQASKGELIRDALQTFLKIHEELEQPIIKESKTEYKIRIPASIISTNKPTLNRSRWKENIRRNEK